MFVHVFVFVCACTCLIICLIFVCLILCVYVCVLSSLSLLFCVCLYVCKSSSHQTKSLFFPTFFFKVAQKRTFSMATSTIRCMILVVLTTIQRMELLLPTVNLAVIPSCGVGPLPSPWIPTTAILSTMHQARLALTMGQLAIV